MSSEQILNEESERKARQKNDKMSISSNKEGMEEDSRKIKLPQNIIYEQIENNNEQQSNLSLTTSENDNNQDHRRQQITNTDAKEITDYYFTFHKNMINIYNSIYSQILQDISNSYNNSFSNVNERVIDYYSIQIENMYNNLTSKRGDNSLKIIDNIITENLDTYIKSMELAQKFYKDVIESYLNCIKK